jgi:hypothetical protein
VTALPVLAAMLVASYKWLKERRRIPSLFAMLPFVLVFAQLATSWTKVQTLTIGFNHHGVGMPPVTRETGKLLERMWAAGVLADDEKVLIEMKPHEMYGIPYFSNHPDRFTVYERNRDDERSDPILATLDYLLVMKDNSAALLLSPELIHRYMRNPSEYEHLAYPFLYGEAPVQVLMIYPPSFPLYTSFKAINPYGEAVGDFYKEGMELPLEAVWNQFPAGAVLHGDLSFIARIDGSKMDLVTRPIALLLASPFVTLGSRGAIGWVRDGKPITASDANAEFVLKGKNEISLECWIPVTGDDFPSRVMEMNIYPTEIIGNTRVIIISELERAFPFPVSGARHKQILTNEATVHLTPDENKETEVLTGFTLMPGNLALHFRTNDIIKNADKTFELDRADMLHLKLILQTLDDYSSVSFKVLKWKYYSAGING